MNSLISGVVSMPSQTRMIGVEQAQVKSGVTKSLSDFSTERLLPMGRCSCSSSEWFIPKNLELLPSNYKTQLFAPQLVDETTLLFLLGGDDIIQCLSSEIASLFNELEQRIMSLSSATVMPSRANLKYSMISLILGLDVEEFLNELLAITLENQQALSALLLLVSVYQSQLANDMTQKNRATYDEQIKTETENTKKSGRLGIFTGGLEALLAGFVVFLGVVASPFTFGASLALAGLAAAPLVLSSLSRISCGAMTVINTEKFGKDETVNSVLRSGFIGLFVSDPKMAMIIKTVVQIVLAVVTMGASISANLSAAALKAGTSALTGVTRIVQTLLQSPFKKSVAIMFKTLNAVVSIAAQAGLLVKMMNANSSEGQQNSILLGASMGVVGLIIHGICSIDEVQNGLETLFGGESGAMIAAMVMSLVGTIASGLLIEGYASGQMGESLESVTLASLASKGKNIIKNLLDFVSTSARGLWAAAGSLLTYITRGGLLDDLIRGITEFGNSVKRFFDDMIKFVKSLNLNSFSNALIAMQRVVVEQILQPVLEYLQTVLASVKGRLLTAAEAVNYLIKGIRHAAQSVGHGFGALFSNLRGLSLERIKDLSHNVLTFLKFMAYEGVVQLSKNCINSLGNFIKHALESLSAQELLVFATAYMSANTAVESVNNSARNILQAVLETEIIKSQEAASFFAAVIKSFEAVVAQGRDNVEQSVAVFTDLMSELAQSIQDANLNERDIIRGERSIVSV